MLIPQDAGTWLGFVIGFIVIVIVITMFRQPPKLP